VSERETLPSPSPIASPMGLGELLPCPFCGIELEEKGVLPIFYQHPRNGCLLDDHTVHDEHAEWNSRASPPPPADAQGGEDDLTKRLRTEAVANHRRATSDLLNEAATRIEASEAAHAQALARIALLEDQVRSAVDGAQPLWSGDVARLEASLAQALALVGRYREALEEGAKYLDALGDNLLRNDADMLLDDCEDPKEIAARLRLAALSEKPDLEESSRNRPLTVTSVADGSLATEGKELSALCEDCPPVGYPTDATRCLPCPRRALLPEAPK